jgi:hypothetical protein
LETHRPSRSPTQPGFGPVWILIGFAFAVAIAFVSAGIGRG